MWAQLFVGISLFLRPKDCCPMPKPAIFKDAPEECGGYSHDHRGRRGLRRSSCESVDCTLKKYKLLKADNSVNTTAFKKYMDKEFGSTYKTAIEKSAAKCKTDVPAGTDCQAQLYTLCFSTEMFVNCPESVSADSSSCAQLKIFLEKCPMPHKHRK